MTAMDTAIPGLHVVRDQFGSDPLENLLSYAESRLDGHARDAVVNYVNSFRADLDANRPLNLSFSSVAAGLPSEQQVQVRALLRDLEVYLLLRRYDMLRRLRDPSLFMDPAQMLETYWLASSHQSDPEMPRVGARLLVHHLSQWDLMCLLHDRIRQCSVILGAVERIDGSGRREEFLRLGRLIAFLRWTPYDWVEDVLLSFLREIQLTDTVEKVRFHTTIVRALYCRTNVRRETIETLCETLFARFDNRLPASLLRTLRGVLVSGGDDTRAFLERKLSENPDRYFTSYFLEVLAWVDKVAAARFLGEHRRELDERLEPREAIELMAQTGERHEMMAEEIVDHWDGASTALKAAVLDAIDEVHCEQACTRLMSMLPQEHDRGLVVAMLDTFASVCRFDEAASLPSRLSTGDRLVYFHAIDSTYRRLLSNPVMLTRLGSLGLLRHFELARQWVYRHYLCVFTFRELMHALREVLAAASRLEPAVPVVIGPDFGPTADEHSLELLRGGDPRAVVLLERALEAASHARERYNEWAWLAGEAATLIESTSGFKPRHADDIFGGNPVRYPASRLPSVKDLIAFGDGRGGPRIEDRVEWLCDAADNAVTLIQQHFLFKEWFVREAPFVLTEALAETVEHIRRGEPLPFSPDIYLDDTCAKRLRADFVVFYECTKQGVYLTDVLLEHLRRCEPSDIPARIQEELTHRRSLVARGELHFDPDDPLDRHVQFTTYAHVYRYGKESLGQPSLTYLWLRYLDAVSTLRAARTGSEWPLLPKHPDAPRMVGPLMETMYQRQRDDARRFLSFVMDVYERFHPMGIRVRVIPNITYGLFCIAPVLHELVKGGIHVSLAGISSRYCDDMNISEFGLSRGSLCPIKTALFSTASNYGTLNHDRILIVVDGTMEPVDRHDPSCIRLPKAHRGYLNHLVAVNYVRSLHGYGMQEPIREVASALHLPYRYVRNVVHTASFKQLLRHLMLSFDRDELARFHREVGTGRTYYSFAQWNTDGLAAVTGPRGFPRQTVPCVHARDVAAPALVFASINGYTEPGTIPAIFDNSPEVERPRIILGPEGAKLDSGWPHEGRGIVVEFPEGENR